MMQLELRTRGARVRIVRGDRRCRHMIRIWRVPSEIVRRFCGPPLTSLQHPTIQYTLQALTRPHCVASFSRSFNLTAFPQLASVIGLRGPALRVKAFTKGQMIAIKWGNSHWLKLEHAHQ
jgi:hypothetical protein